MYIIFPFRFEMSNIEEQGKGAHASPRKMIPNPAKKNLQKVCKDIEIFCSFWKNSADFLKTAKYL